MTEPGGPFPMLSDVSAQDLLLRVPDVTISFDGDCSQSAGLELPILVINLAHRTDRWQAVSRRMTAVGLDKLVKVPAVAGARLPPETIAALLGPGADRIDAAPRSHLTLTRPALGCFLSHLAIWRWLIDNNVPQALVLEDDATPAADFDAARLRAALGALPPDAGLVFLGRIIMNGMADRAEHGGLARLYYFNGTFAYLVTPAACRTLLPHVLPPDRHIDHQISRALVERRDDFAALYTEPAFFEPDWSLRSDCYVPLAGETDADRELGALLASSRQLLLDDRRPLLAPA